jgi:hypothetical protein
VENILSHLDILGYKVRDRVTGIDGVATSVSFDLYGCIQVVINPGLDKDGKHRDSHFYDISRLERMSSERVMEPPDYIAGAIAEGKQGAAEKPAVGP